MKLSSCRVARSRRTCVAWSGVVATALLLAACGGGGGGGSNAVSATCRPGLITGFSGEQGDAPLGLVGLQTGDGGDAGGAGGDSVGDGGGNGVGGGDGQYANVEVTVEMANGTTFGPWTVDADKGMVTLVPCGLPLPAKLSIEGKAANASYYDEGLGRDVSFAGGKRIGLMTSYDGNVGVTPLSHALYERTMRLGAQRGTAEGWKDKALIDEAHAELLAIVNGQLPGFHRLTDLRRLPIALNARTDRIGSASLAANQNGIYGALLSGLAKTGATALPASPNPALAIADALIADLADGRLDALSAEGAPVGVAGTTPYAVESLWSHATVGTGLSARTNGAGTLATDAMPIGYVRAKTGATLPAGAVAETAYVLGSNGRLVVSLNPSISGGAAAKPAGEVAFSQLYRFGASPVIAVRRDGKGMLVFPNAWDGMVSYEVVPATNQTIVELFDAQGPVVRLSDGSLARLQGGALVPQPAPSGVLDYGCRTELSGALASPGDAALGAASGSVCYGVTRSARAKVWRANTAASGREFALERVVQVNGNEQVTLALLADGTVWQLDADHAIAGADRTLAAPGAAPVRIDVPRACSIRAPFVVACDGGAYAIDYREYTDAGGAFLGAGPVTGVRRLPIPASVWRARANRKLGSSEAESGVDAVFLGTDGRVYDLAGQPLNLPLDGATLSRGNQPPLQPTLANVAGDDVLTAAEARSGLTVQGTAEPGSAITVKLAGVTRNTTADSSGNWQVVFAPAELPKTDGTAIVEASASNPNGASPAASRSVRIVVSVPAAPTINAVTGDDVVTPAEAGASVTVGGTAGPGTSVTVNWGGATRVTSTGSGTGWSVSFGPNEVPKPGATTVSVTASNENGAGPAATRAVQVREAAPATPTIAAVTGDNAVSADEAKAGVTISGTATPGSTVQVNWQGNVKTATADGGSNWRVAYAPGEVPAAGRTTVTAIATNSGGPSAPASVSVDIAAPPPVVVVPPTPTINPVASDNVVSLEEAKTAVALSGTAAAGSNVNVDWQGKTKAAVANASSLWSVTYAPSELPAPGKTTVRVTASNSAGTSQPATLAVEIVAPPPVVDPPVVNAVTGDDVVSVAEKNQGFEISGTVTPGDGTITVNWQGTARTVNVSANSPGLPWTWSLRYVATQVPAPGRTTVSVTLTRGGVSSAPTNRAVTIEAPPVVVVPPPPVVASPKAGTVFGPGTLEVQYPVSGTAAVGTTVTVTWDGIAGYSSPATTDAKGNWLVEFGAGNLPSTNGKLVPSTIVAVASNSAGRSSETRVQVYVGIPETPGTCGAIGAPPCELDER